MNKSHKRILLAVDGSEGALEAVRYISRISMFQNMQLVLFNVFSTIHEYFWDLELGPQNHLRLEEFKGFQEQPEKTAGEYMERAKQILVDAGFSEDGVNISMPQRKTGIARDIITESQRGYSAVVIGRKGVSDLEDLVLGGVAAKLLEKLAFVSLMVVGKSPQPGKVLLALDSSEGAMGAVDYVATMLGGSNVEVELIHVIRGDTKERLEEATNRIIVAFMRAKNRLIQSGFRPDQIANITITRVNSRAGAIIEEANRHGYGTIVMGRKGLSEVEEFSMGRVSNKVVQLARNHAVWVVS